MKKTMNWKNDLKVAGQISYIRPLGTLKEKVKAAHTAMLVIDMQNDFCSPGGLVSKDGRDISAAEELVKRLPSFISMARDAGVLIIFIRCVYTTEKNFYLSDVWLEQAARKREGGYTRIPVCRDGSWEGAYSGDVRPELGDPVVTKHRYSAFHNTNLDTILRANAIRTLVLTGVVSNVCVETTAREGFVRDYYIVVPEDGTAAYVPADHAASMSNIDRFFGETTTIKTITSIWTSNQFVDVNPALVRQ